MCGPGMMLSKIQKKSRRDIDAAYQKTKWHVDMLTLKHVHDERLNLNLLKDETSVWTLMIGLDQAIGWNMTATMW